MTNNPVLDYMVMRDMGWLIKGAGKLQTAGIIAGLATGLGSVGYGELQRRKMKKFEDNRELVAAINDTLSRRAISDIYTQAGLQAPHIPLAVSKNISSQYGDMVGKSAGIKDIGNITAKIFGNRKRVGKFHNYPVKKDI